MKLTYSHSLHKQTRLIRAMMTMALIFFIAGISKIQAANETATRFYLQNANSSVTTTTQGAWSYTTGAPTLVMSKTKSGINTNRVVIETSSTSGYDVMILKFVSDPIPPQTISGSTTLNWVIGDRESSTSANMYWAVDIYVVSNDGGTIRGNLYSDYRESSGEWSTTASGDAPQSALTLSSVTAQANDRIVIEIGYIARNTSTTSYNGTLYYGGTGNDLTVGSGNVNTNTGWFEFSPGLYPTAPSITSFSPTSACYGSGTSVTITGMSFTGATSVTFNGVSSSFTVNSDNQITATLPSTATTGAISVTTPYGTGTSSNIFTVHSLPTSVTISPSSATICNGDIQQLTASGGAAYNTPAYSELFNGTTTGFTVSGPSTTATRNTSYYAEGTSSYLFNCSSYNPDGGGSTPKGYYTQTNAIDISGLTSPKLVFSHICALEDATTIYDIGAVEYSLNGGSSWTVFPASSYAGSGTLVTNYYWGAVSGVYFSTRSYPDWITQFPLATSTPGTPPATNLWKTETINIPAVSSNFKIRFVYYQDETVVWYGWLIDNLTITGLTNSFTWTPTTSLYTDAGANNSYTLGTITPTVYAKPLSTITYTALSTSSLGCTNSADATLTVSQPSVAPTGISGTTAICNGSSTTLTATGGTLGIGANYQWGTGLTVGTNPISGANSLSYLASPTTTTTYWVRIENTASPCTATTGGVTQAVTVNDPPDFSYDFTDVACYGGVDGSITITANGGATPYYYRYKLSGGSWIGGDQEGWIQFTSGDTQDISPLGPATYIIEVKDSNGCVQTACTGP